MQHSSEAQVKRSVQPVMMPSRRWAGRKTAWLAALGRPPHAALHLCLSVALAGGFTAGQAQTTTAPTTNLSFSLPRAATTSAGVYNEQGQLVRTLWRGEKLSKGTYSRSWDQKDDGGQRVAGGTYQIRLLHHNLKYVWEGVIGNSSASFEGPEVHRAFQVPTSLAIRDGSCEPPVRDQHLYYAVGYNEGQDGIHGFELSAPQRVTLPFPTTDTYAAHTMVAADEKRLYWTNLSPTLGGRPPTSFVGVFNACNRQPDEFTEAGVTVVLGNTALGNYFSVIDVGTTDAEAPTGLAVQRGGRVLAVAHGGKNLIRLFDKTTGNLLSEFSLPLAANALNQLAMSPNGDLWVISGSDVLRYTGLGVKSPILAATIKGLAKPLALATSPVDDEVWVADGGPSQQLKRFDRRGRALGVIGTMGGYASSPIVRGDKLCFRDVGEREQTAVAVGPDRTLWVVDYCNNRMLRFPIANMRTTTSDTQVAYLPVVYASTVDHGNRRRVFANFLEFDVDTNSALVPGRSSWKLVRNWLAGLPGELKDEWAVNRAYGGFASVETLSNGRTYGLIKTLRNQQYVVELPASGPLRIVKSLPVPDAGATALVLYENGELGYSLTDNTMQSVMRLPLAFDSAGNPDWWSGDPTQLAAVPTLDGSPYYRQGKFSGIMPPRFPVTGAGRVVFFDQSERGNEGFHLGAASLGSTEWLWQASPSGELDGKGSFQTQTIDATVNYAGNAVWAYDRHIVYGYHGEFFTDLQNGIIGQANQFMHFDESGLFLGQFGVPSTRATIEAQKGLAGNAFSPTLVGDGRRLFLYHNDESVHGGVHRWRIDGWKEVQELKGSGVLTGDTIVLQ